MLAYKNNDNWTPSIRSYELSGGVKLELGHRTLIMGILNTTPDSFSDGGRFLEIEAAVQHARAMVADGVDIIDIGGESTRPGGEKVGLEEELRRVLPVIRAIRQELPDTAISIDTYKAETARQALEAGAHIINDVWALQADEDMASVAAAYGCPVILSHNRHDRNYADFIPDVIADLRSSIGTALAAGVAAEQIWLDPGIGFAKDYENNLTMMGNLQQLTAIGYPVLLATSRKRFIQNTLQLAAEQSIFGTAATVTLGIAQGCQIVRVHDVKEMKQTAKMADAIVYRQKSLRNEF
ncbi:dihydropteroate synthase [Paenibacillus oenotherae]|uniref:Dihydropteroate synthase n=1 Tax=Paenibacillus oenotherae TaxID=1435645 RepID=A0ABS7DC04_9BACL|nr:dihydropteroate synthase [Paenibacillus oenotherae]MBW7477431.1 dihydropteroate synthase [Paenibacillus oenotherae]